jgi:hypothetical protein
MRAVIADLPTHWATERMNAEVAQWDEMWDGVLHMPPMPNRVHQDFEMDFANVLKHERARPNGCRVHHQVNLTTPEDEEAWTKNYRIPDLVLLTPVFAGLGVPEVWFVHRDTKRPTVFELRTGHYHERPADADGWVTSPATGLDFRQTPANTLEARIPGRGVFEVPTPNS